MNNIDMLFVLFLRKAQAEEKGELDEVKSLHICLHLNKKNEYKN